MSKSPKKKKKRTKRKPGKQYPILPLYMENILVTADISDVGKGDFQQVEPSEVQQGQEKDSGSTSHSEVSFVTKQIARTKEMIRDNARAILACKHGLERTSHVLRQEYLQQRLTRDNQVNLNTLDPQALVFKPGRVMHLPETGTPSPDSSMASSSIDQSSASLASSMPTVADDA